jgi:hypothetical protein
MRPSSSDCLGTGAKFMQDALQLGYTAFRQLIQVRPGSCSLAG